MKLSKQKVMEGVGKVKPAQQPMVVKDPRFSRLHSDPRFQRAFKRKLKIPIDSRFSHVFSDMRFSDPLGLDKRGKPRKHSQKSCKKRNALHQYYHLHDGDDGDEAAFEENFSKSPKNGKKPSSDTSQNSLLNGKTRKLSSPSPEEEVKDERLPSEAISPRASMRNKGRDDITQKQSRARSQSEVMRPYGFDSEDQHAESTSDEDSKSYDRSIQSEGLGPEYGSNEKDASEESSETSSVSSSSFEYSDDEEDLADSPSEAEDEKVATTEMETRRLALVNMDWDHIQAVDILAVMNSFLPKSGQISSVSVFPSEFGLQQMKEEEKQGPQGLFESENDDEDGDDGVDMERLRKYEKDKLRYYYAVIECDSIATAGFLYQSCDGMEFERTSNTLDLRFIPDDMRFLNSARDVATQVPAEYQAPVFETRALQHSKVKLTWDDDEPDRVKNLRQKFTAEQLNDLDFKAYLASDSDNESSDDVEGDVENNQHEDEARLHPETTKTGNVRKGIRDKYRNLLLGSEEAPEGKDLKKHDQDMEITFHSGLEELSKRLMNKHKQSGGDETVWEAYLRKKKEKRKLRKHSQDAQDEDMDNVGEHNVDDDHHVQGGTGFDDPFFKSSEGVDFAASEGTDSERELVPVAKQKRNKLSQKKVEVEEKKRADERSRAELELLFVDDELSAGNGVKGYNLKKQLGKRKEADTLPDKLPTVNYDDSRFSALFTSHRFAIDPTEPEFKRSAAQLRPLLEKQQKQLPLVHEVVDFKKSEPMKVANTAKQDFSLMVRSVKQKYAKRS